MSKFTLSPYRKGMGPVADVIFGDRYITIRSRIVGDPHKTRTVFETETRHWRPASRSTMADQVADIVGFAAAYAERPDEFDRSPSDYEQVESAWWERHGDAMQAEADHRAGRE